MTAKRVLMRPRTFAPLATPLFEALNKQAEKPRKLRVA